jgi:GTP-binding protein HflX
VGTFNVTIGIGDTTGQRFEEVEALVDTGSTYTVLPASILGRLGVTSHRRSRFELANGREVEWEMGRAWVRLNGQTEMTLVVFGNDDADPILGAVTLEEFLLAPDPIRQTLVPVSGLLKEARVRPARFGSQRRSVLHSTEPVTERAYLVAVQARGRRDGLDAESSLEELALLAHTAGAEVVGRTSQRLDSPNSALYIGKGKLDEIIAEREDSGYTTVIFDDELSPSQQRNLENALGVKVLDRTALIIDIFARRAQTREARLQVELAQSQYLLPRLAGQWSHLERLEGKIGVRGPGESQLETDRRLVRNRITKLRREMDDVRQQRSLYRRRRQRQGAKVVALVGYTNAGKSTLMRALSGADVLTEDLLFATLDPVTRRIHLPSGNEALLTDTVGFIQKLPTQLVAAFRATLEELTDADLLLHLVDITHPDAEEQYSTVERTLAELGLADKPRIVAFNKVDLLAGSDGQPPALAEIESALRQEHPEALLVSAARGWNLEALLQVIEAHLAQAPDKRYAPGRAG